MNLVCWNCGESLDDLPMPISRHATCDNCHEPLHACRMCRHYLTQRPYCDHDLADPPQVKENANFCDYFKPTNRFDGSRANRVDSAKSALDDLFGDDQEDPSSGEAPSADDEARRRLDDLFD